MKKIIFCLAMMLLVVSCGKPESQKSFEKFMGIIQSGDAKKYDKYMKELGHDEVKLEKQKEAQFLLEQFKKVEYQVLSVQEEKDTSKIMVNVKAPDLSGYVEEIVQEFLKNAVAGNDENKFFNQKMLEALNRPDLKYENTELTVTMIKRDNKWIISPDDFENSKFMAILTGSLYKLGK